MEIPVIVCIGSSGVSGDRLGPLVGDLLRGKYNVKAYVYGGINQPVNGVNYTLYLEHIKRRHKKSLVIAIDACVGEDKDVGKIKYTLQGVNAGGALNKKLARIGDVGILGVVASKQQDNLTALMSASSQMVETMSRSIAEKVYRMLMHIGETEPLI